MSELTGLLDAPCKPERRGSMSFPHRHVGGSWQSGQAVVEQALLLVLVGLAVVAAILILGSLLDGLGRTLAVGLEPAVWPERTDEQTMVASGITVRSGATEIHIGRAHFGLGAICLAVAVFGLLFWSTQKNGLF